MKKTKTELYEEPTMFVFVNKGLGMSISKTMEQICHAMEEIQYWIYNMKDEEHQNRYYDNMAQQIRTLVIKEVADTEELYEVNSYLESLGLITGIYVDLGSEAEGYLLKPTAMVVEYVEGSDSQTRLVFDRFPNWNPDKKTWRNKRK